jgi:molecular chaperone GrpE
MDDDLEKSVERMEPEAEEPAAAAEPELGAAEPPAAAEVEVAAEAEAVNLEAELAQARTQAEEYLDRWRRTAAEFANYRKRVEREREEVSRFANSLLLGKLLPIVDDLERAMATLPPDLSRFSWVEGVALIQRKFAFILEGEGLKPIEAAGQPFDPERHEAVLREETAACPDGQVVAELQRGYALHGRVLRPALVKVAVAPPAEGDVVRSA